MRHGAESRKKVAHCRFESYPDYKGSTRESLMRKEYPCCTAWKDRQLARVVELVVTLDLGSSIERCESSSLSLCTRPGSSPGSMSNTMRSKVIPCMELLIGKRSIRFD